MHICSLSQTFTFLQFAARFYLTAYMTGYDKHRQYNIHLPIIRLEPIKSAIKLDDSNKVWCNIGRLFIIRILFQFMSMDISGYSYNKTRMTIELNDLYNDACTFRIDKLDKLFVKYVVPSVHKMIVNILIRNSKFYT